MDRDYMRTRLEAELTDDLSNQAWGSKSVCRHCGYELAGLADEGNCPECGQPFSDKLIIYGCRRFRGWWKMGSATLFACSMIIWFVISIRLATSFVLCVTSLFVLLLTLRRELRRMRVRKATGGDYRWLVEVSGIYFGSFDGKEEHYTPWRDIERITMRRRHTRSKSGLSSTRYRIEERGRPFKRAWLLGFSYKDDLHLPDLDEEQANELLQEIRSHQNADDVE
jgi:hypothetical protein